MDGWASPSVSRSLCSSICAVAEDGRCLINDQIPTSPQAAPSYPPSWGLRPLTCLWGEPPGHTVWEPPCLLSQSCPGGGFSGVGAGSCPSIPAHCVLGRPGGGRCLWGGRLVGVSLSFLLHPVSMQWLRAGVWRRGNIRSPPWGARPSAGSQAPPPCSVSGGPSRPCKKHPRVPSCRLMACQPPLGAGDPVSTAESALAPGAA